MKRLLLSIVLAAATAFPAAAQSGKLSISNESGKVITAVHVSPIDVDRYGPNLLRGSQLQNGAAYSFADLPNGLYDMRVVSGDGAECLLKDIDFFQYTVWTVTRNCGAFGGTGG